MNRYNVVRSKCDGSGGGGESLPAILDAVLDGEIPASDPRVVETLRSDADAARRFHETQRLTDRLSRRLATPDLSGSILAVVHAKQPFAPVRRRRRVSPQRIAFAGGLVAGIAIVILLQTVAKAPRFETPRDVRSTIANADDAANGSGIVVSTAAEPARATRTPWALNNSAKYEASTTSGTEPSAVKVAGLGGDMKVDSSIAMVAIGPATTIGSDPCASPTSEIGLASSAGSFTPSSLTAPESRAAGFVAAAPLAANEQSQQWPPADITAFIDHISLCGVSDELAMPNRSR